MTETTTNFNNWIQDHIHSEEPTDFALSAELRSASLAILNAGIFPTRKDEEWRYTPLKDVLDRKLEFLPKQELDPALIFEYKKAIPHAQHIVFINGEYSPEFSDDLAQQVNAGIDIQLMTELDSTSRDAAEEIVKNSKLSDDNIFQHIAMGLSQSGIFMRIADNVEVDTPIHLLFLLQGLFYLVLNL